MSDSNHDKQNKIEKEGTEMLSDHEKRISDLERQHQELSAKMTEVENTIMKSNQTTQELQKDIRNMQETTNQHQEDIKTMQQESGEKVDKVFDMLYGLASQQNNINSSAHETKMKSKTKVTIGIAIALFGGGGLLKLVEVVSNLF